MASENRKRVLPLTGSLYPYEVFTVDLIDFVIDTSDMKIIGRVVVALQ